MEILAAPHKGHFRPPAKSCCLTTESFTHCLQHGRDTASLRKVLLIGHLRYSGTSFMSMFKVAEDSLLVRYSRCVTKGNGEKKTGKYERKELSY